MQLVNFREPSVINEGSAWFRRFHKECKKISKHIRFKRIKYGFYRLYWKQAYLHEVYKEMPMKGYDKEEIDPRLESREYYQEYEDNVEITRKIKNFVEGYWDSIRRVKTRVHQMQNDKEFYETARNAYKQMRVK